jgi:transcriptional regulator with XRE-family HTH domain
MTSNRSSAQAARSSYKNDAQEADVATLSTAPPVAPHTLEQAIGAQVRALRKRAEITAAEVANLAGISTGMLSKIESGSISASLSTLQAVATALNVPISQLFAAFEEQRDCSFVRAGQGVVIERRGTKAGHQYSLLGHGLGGPVVVV